MAFVVEKNGAKYLAKCGFNVSSVWAVRTEYRAYQLSCALGLDVVPYSWVEEFSEGTVFFQRWIEGATDGAMLCEASFPLVLFDFLIFSIDRSFTRNVIVGPDGKIYGIDNEISFLPTVGSWYKRNFRNSPGKSDFCNAVVESQDSRLAEIFQLSFDGLTRTSYKELLQSFGVSGRANEEAVMRVTMLLRYGSFTVAWAKWKEYLRR